MWTIVYISCICTGFKEEIYYMLLFVLGLNIAWEVIYSADVVIVDTYFKYRKEDFPENANKQFVSFSILTLCHLCRFTARLYSKYFLDYPRHFFNPFFLKCRMVPEPFYIQRGGMGQNKRLLPVNFKILKNQIC